MKGCNIAPQNPFAILRNFMIYGVLEPAWQTYIFGNCIVPPHLQQVGFLENNDCPLIRDDQHQQPAYEQNCIHGLLLCFNIRNYPAQSKEPEKKSMLKPFLLTPHPLPLTQRATIQADITTQKVALA
jgi:hypothetical protein